jgi:tripartite-type tricarboxylate transporter receptor subunit TctC
MAKVLKGQNLQALFCHRKIISLLACLFAFLPLGTYAQTTWPTRAVTIVVPFTPGGGTDVGTRVVAQRLSQLWGQPVLVENRAGAGGNVGLEAVSRAKPDGYTLLTGNVGTQSINPTLYKKLNYNPDSSFTPISLIAELPFAMVVTPTLPVKTPQELVALSKAQPNLLSYASSGSGGSPHLSMETFKIATGAKIQHVPYKGGSAAITDLMSGNVQVLMVSILETSAYVKAGKLKGLAVTSKSRSPAMPDVPTMVEAGITGAESGSWIGFLAPQGTPKEIIDKIAAGVKEVVAMPEVSQQLIAQGAVPMSSTPNQFAELIANDRKRYARIITENQLTAD